MTDDDTISCQDEIYSYFLLFNYWLLVKISIRWFKSYAIYTVSFIYGL